VAREVHIKWCTKNVWDMLSMKDDSKNINFVNCCIGKYQNNVPTKYLSK